MVSMSCHEVHLKVEDAEDAEMNGITNDCM